MNNIDNEKLLKTTNELTWMLLASLGLCNSLNKSLVQEFFKIDSNPEKVMQLTQSSIYKNIINIGANTLSELTQFGDMVSQYINNLDPDVRDAITKFTKERVHELADWQADKQCMSNLINKPGDTNEPSNNINPPSTTTIQ